MAIVSEKTIPIRSDFFSSFLLCTEPACYFLAYQYFRVSISVKQILRIGVYGYRLREDYPYQIGLLQFVLALHRARLLFPCLSVFSCQHQCKADPAHRCLWLSSQRRLSLSDRTSSVRSCFAPSPPVISLPISIFVSASV